MSKIFFHRFITNMEIRNNQTYQQNFKALHIADTKNYLKNIETPINIYLLGEKDQKYLNSLKKSINFKDLMPKLPENLREVWQGVFNVAITQSSNKKKVGVIAFSENKPCGLMVFTPESFRYKLDTICTWPTKPEKRVPFAGKTLFKIMFEDFLKSSAKFIDLDAVTNGPFNAVSKYMSLGFKQRGGENCIIAMRSQRENIQKTAENLDKFIKIKMPQTLEEIDLEKIGFPPSK